MPCRFAALVLAGAIGLTAGAHGQGNLDDQGHVRSDYAPITLRVACGGILKAACVKVVPRIAARAGKSGLDLKAVGSGRTFDTAAAVCDGEAAATIVQSDALALVGRQPSCLGRYDVVGRPLYPYYAFLVAKADAPYRQLEDLAASNGRRRLIMAGAEGTGGQITIGYLLRSDPALQRAVTLMIGDLDFGLSKVADGSIDAVFAVESLDSDVIDRVRLKRDASGKPTYRFIDIRPVPEFFRIGDMGHHCLYRVAALDYGGAAPVTTVSLDAVMALVRTFRDAHARGGPRAADALASAIDNAQPAILADMKSSPDWRPAGTSCQ